ncbi:MAG: NAD-dependent epimerase/dehydratase family protein [Candidatus Micrarchaeota archaeon]
MGKILVTGAFGLVGSELVPALQKKHGVEKVIALVHTHAPEHFEGVVEKGDVTDKACIEKFIKQDDVTEIYHLAGILSAGSEKNPEAAWAVNLGGLKNVLDLSVKHKLKVFWPSSIAAFGPTTPKEKVPQHTVLEPTTIYGVAKVSGELLCQYYFQRYGLDVRSLRYPGLIGWRAPPGDGTTEYAISIFYGAIKEKKYTCFLKEDSVLPMMYLDDAIKGTLDLMDATKDKIRIRTSYNFTAVSFAPKDIYLELKKHVPELKITYEPDQRQKIADSWPKTIDDSAARKDWNWKPKYDLATMTKDMYGHLSEKLKS